MTDRDKLVEIVARAMHAALKNDHENSYVAAFQDGTRFDDNYEKAIADTTTIDGEFDLVGVTRSILTAIEEAGWAVVPRNPTEAVVAELTDFSYGTDRATDEEARKFWTDLCALSS